MKFMAVGIVQDISDLANEIKEAQWDVTDAEALSIAARLLQVEALRSLYDDHEYPNAIECFIDMAIKALKKENVLR
jgi:hypothetical protein